MTPPPKLPAAVVGNVGMYYACYKLSLLGWNVMPTARNAKGIDIVAYNQTGEEMIGIQVKTLSKRNAVPLGLSLDNIMGDFWVIVNNAVVADGPNVFIMTANEVRKNACRDKGGKRAYWLEKRTKRTKKTNNRGSYENPKFAEAWCKIGRGDCVKP